MGPQSRFEFVLYFIPFYLIENSSQFGVLAGDSNTKKRKKKQSDKKLMETTNKYGYQL